jgi:hypothetical protein
MRDVGGFAIAATAGGKGSGSVEMEPSTALAPSHCEAAPRAGTAGDGGDKGGSGRSNSEPATLILASPAGAAEQPKTVQPPFSSKHSG